MADALTLIASKSDFEDRIHLLETYLSSLNETLSKYQNLKDRTESFMQGKDSNFEKMQQRVEVNIGAVRKAIRLCEASRNNLQVTVNQMDEATGKIGSLIDTAVDTAKSGIEAAIRVDSLL